MVAESPRWLFRRGRKDEALAALLRSRSRGRADLEMKEMEDAELAEKAEVPRPASKVKESLLRRKYVVPFLLACIILACNQVTGVNSIIGYNATILIQAGLSDVQAHWGYVILTSVNFLVTMLGVDARGPQGPQVSALDRQRGHHSFARLRGARFPPNGKVTASIAGKPCRRW